MEYTGELEYAKQVLTERLIILNNSYDEFVIKGNVDKDSKVALENRDKANSLKKSLDILKANHI
jgi:hypothetical protein